jgi:hypothetical protein
VGCIEALSLETMDAEPAAPEKAMAFVDSQIRSSFRDFVPLFSFVDKTYDGFIRPYFDELAKRTL